MRRLSRVLLLVLLPLSLLAACGDDDDDEGVGAGDGETSSTVEEADDDGGSGADHTLTVDDAGSEVAVDAGDAVDIVLESCPSCGYTWSDTGGPYTGVLELIGEEDTNPTADASAGEVGGYVDHVFHYEAVGAGTAEVVLEYFPPGEQPSEETFTVTITVGG